MDEREERRPRRRAAPGGTKRGHCAFPSNPRPSIKVGEVTLLVNLDWRVWLMAFISGGRPTQSRWDFVEATPWARRNCKSRCGRSSHALAHARAGSDLRRPFSRHAFSSAAAVFISLTGQYGRELLSERDEVRTKGETGPFPPPSPTLLRAGCVYGVECFVSARVITTTTLFSPPLCRRLYPVTHPPLAGICTNAPRAGPSIWETTSPAPSARRCRPPELYFFVTYRKSGGAQPTHTCACVGQAGPGGRACVMYDERRPAN